MKKVDDKLKMVYLDNSATTPVRKEVRILIHDLMEQGFGNPSSLYDLGIASEKILKESRRIIAKTLKARENEIIFTSCGSESNNMAIRGIAETYRKRGKHMITTAVEHPSVLRTMEDLEDHGYEVTYIPVDPKGNPDMEAFAKSLRKDTILAAMMMVNNEVGTIFPIREAAALIRAQSPDCHFHVDGVQAYGRLAVDIKKLDVDTFALSGHKIGAPKGIGALYVKEGLRLHPLISGGGQEQGLRAGTENYYYIGGLALAAKLILEDRDKKNTAMAAMKDALLKALAKEDVEFSINGNGDENDVPYILNLSFPGVKSEVLLHYLEGEHIYVSQGSACHSRTKGSSETLMAMGRNDEERDASLRFSFADDTPIEAMGRVARAVKAGVEMIALMRGGK